jgi:hypothetical protein
LPSRRCQGHSKISCGKSCDQSSMAISQKAGLSD